MKKTTLFLLTLTIMTGACHQKLQTNQTKEMNTKYSIENNQWRLVKISGADSIPKVQKEIFIQFNKADSTFSGNAGCNNLTGRYTSDGNKLSFGPAAMTRMMCPPEQMNIEALFTKAIGATDNYIISKEILELRKGAETLASFAVVYHK